MTIAARRQREIYMRGLLGFKPRLPLTYESLRHHARAKLRSEAFDYLDGGAGDHLTMKANKEAFEQWKIKPGVMRDVGNIDLHTTYLGREQRNPFFLCPIGVLELAHKESDVEVMRAAEAMQVPMMISNQASQPMEKIANVRSFGSIMFQLYWSKSDELVQSFLNRAEKIGCEAVIVTLDTIMLGWRSRDLQQAFLPFLYAMGMAQYTSDPIFNTLVDQSDDTPDESAPIKPNLTLLWSLYKMSKRFPGSTWKNFMTKKPLSAIKKFIEVFMRPSLQWSDLPSLRKMTKLPIILKGIQREDDAKRAVDLGVDGIIVSNHGGRQVDGALGSLDALAKINASVGDEIDLLFDSGVRSGADAFKAIALGAKAVGIGRPYAFALALRGQEGVKDLLTNYLSELELTMALSGCRDINAISRDFLYREKK